MRIVDLTHTVRPGMPVFPGTQPPVLTPANTIEKDGFAETLLSFYSHTGTHMDAPAHIFSGRSALDELPAGQFLGQALILDCTCVSSVIGMEVLHKAGPGLHAAEYVIFHTGWSGKWGSPEYFEGFPCISGDVADYLAASGKKGIGLDAISADPVDDASLSNHKRILSGGLVIVENLAHLEQVGSGLFTFLALPLKFAGADGAPVRAMAILDD